MNYTEFKKKKPFISCSVFTVCTEAKLFKIFGLFLSFCPHSVLCFFLTDLYWLSPIVHIVLYSNEMRLFIGMALQGWGVSIHVSALTWVRYHFFKRVWLYFTRKRTGFYALCLGKSALLLLCFSSTHNLVAAFSLAELVILVVDFV